MSFITTILAALRFRASEPQAEPTTGISYRMRVDTRQSWRGRFDTLVTHGARLNTTRTHRLRVDSHD